MTDLNSVVVVGRITQDVGADERSFTHVNGGTAKAVVSIASNRSRKNGDEWIEEVSFFNITLWGKTAENLKPCLTKGRQICIQGHLKQDRWEKDGQKQSKLSVVADSVQLLGGVNSNSSSNTGSVQSVSNPYKPNNTNSGMDNNYMNQQEVAGVDNAFNNPYEEYPTQQEFDMYNELY